MIAGPTELGIIADSTANPELISSDLISQAEHSVDTFCFVLTTSEKVAKNIIKSLKQKIRNIKRKEIVQKSFGKNTPSAASDYLLGSNHILPTNGFGKVRGSLSVLDFMKLGTEVESSKLALRKISKYMNTLCNSETLPNHYEAVRSRLK